MNIEEKTDLAQWTQVGEGGNGKTYVNQDTPDVILKVNNERLSTLEAVKKEFSVSKAVNELGVPSPKMHKIVKVGEAYGTISERILHKKSLSRICADDPSRIAEMAAFMCKEGKALHEKPCDTSFFPSRKAQLTEALDKVQFIGSRNKEILKAFAATISDATTCSHGDFNMGNLVLSGDKPYWIDLDRFGYGDPMFDIGHLFQICHVYAPMKQVQEIFHMSEEQFGLFWDAFAKAYTGKEEHEDFDRLAGKYATLDIPLRYIFNKPTFPEKIFFAINIRKLVKKYF